MADLDAELLALAGDASSDEEDAPMNISGASSMSPDARHGDGSAKPGKKSGGRRGRKSDENDSEEEGEAYVFYLTLDINMQMFTTCEPHYFSARIPLGFFTHF